jgi:molybdopterin converting factor small subunit
MKVKVEFFGSARYLTNTKEVEVDLPVGATLRELANLLSKIFPKIADKILLEGRPLGSFVLRLNRGPTARGFDEKLDEGCNVLVIPAEAGG